jgi:hypothetical protein
VLAFVVTLNPAGAAFGVPALAGDRAGLQPAGDS